MKWPTGVIHSRCQLRHAYPPISSNGEATCGYMCRWGNERECRRKVPQAHSAMGAGAGSNCAGHWALWLLWDPWECWGWCIASSGGIHSPRPPPVRTQERLLSLLFGPSHDRACKCHCLQLPIHAWPKGLADGTRLPTAHICISLWVVYCTACDISPQGNPVTTSVHGKSGTLYASVPCTGKAEWASAVGRRGCVVGGYEWGWQHVSYARWRICIHSCILRKVWNVQG